MSSEIFNTCCCFLLFNLFIFRRYVPDEDRVMRLLKALQKTAPPVLIFAENQRDVDDIHEFLLLRNVEAVSIHGGKTQQERSEAVRLFKEGKKDVLVSADVGAKGKQEKKKLPSYLFPPLFREVLIFLESSM